MIVIGEKINATRPDVSDIIEQRRKDQLLGLALKQAEAGANYIDINVGTGKGNQQDEVDAIRWAVSILLSKVDKPLCVDSADPVVLEAGLEAMQGRSAMINSIKADDALLSAIPPLAMEYGASLVALAMDEKGIPGTVDERLMVCKRIADGCKEYGLPLTSVYFDPLVLPISADSRQSKVTLNTLSSIKSNFPEAHTVLGLSNISYGLPGRTVLNSAFLHMAIYAGLDAAIMDPLNEDMMQAARTGDALMGKDRHFRKYCRAFRKRVA